MEANDLGSFGKIKLAGYLALITGTANAVIGFIMMSEGSVPIGLLAIVSGASLLAAGVGLITAKTIAQFLLWSKVYGLTMIVGFAGSVLITRQFSGIGFLPILGMLIISLIFNRMVKADVVTSKSLVVAKEKSPA